MHLFRLALFPQSSSVDLRRWDLQAKRDVIASGAAVLAFKARNGSFPDSLEQALPDMPQDPYRAAPLNYRREGEGFVVYSVGATGKFDGGQPGEPQYDKDRVFSRIPLS